MIIPGGIAMRPDNFVGDERAQSPPFVENASILTPTTGFLKAGYTHSINSVGSARAR
jgi:hypothetical protein